MEFRLIYLQEGLPYPIGNLRNVVRTQLLQSASGPQAHVEKDSSSGEDIPWLDDGFFYRFAEAMNHGPKIANKGNGKISFDFVGLYDYCDGETGKSLTFFFMPKFCKIEESGCVAPEKRDAVLLAIDRYIKELELPEVQSEDANAHQESLLELAVRVLRDYLENGVYTKQQRELEYNGQGEIDWETTIDQYQPVFLKGQDGRKRPVYMDTATELATSDEDHYITRLHQCLVTTWGRKLEELGISSIIKVNVPLLSEDELDFFGDENVQLDHIKKELSVQFVTKSRHTLFLMKELIEKSSNSDNSFAKQLSFGTNKAEHLWEKACAAVLGSELEKPIDRSSFSWPVATKYGDYLPKPIWQDKSNSRVEDIPVEGDEKDASDSSIKSGWKLDFIRTWPKERPVQKLVILDAKYYDVSWDPPDGKNKKIQHQPGIGDIAKQIFYQMAFEDLLPTKKEGTDIGFVNAFLFPKDDELSTDISIGETVHLGWKNPMLREKAVAFSSINLFTVYIPGIELLRRYANYRIENEWIDIIVGLEPKKRADSST